MAVPTLISTRAWASPSRPAANDRIRVGLIGPGYRARDLVKESPPELEYVSLADCDLRQIDAFRTWAAEALPGRLAETCPQYQDYREMLEKEKLDAVVIATTTHARALICIHAMQAGLDVYAEKPLTLTIEEGQYLIRAEKKYGRVFQTGTQQRSIPINNFGSDLVKNGALGRIHTVICPNFIGPELLDASVTFGDDSRGNELGHVVPSDRVGALQSASASRSGPLGTLARLRWGRAGLGSDRLGGACIRSGSACTGHGQHRSRGSVAGR